MPPKKKGACPSVNPQLYEKSMKPSMTMAMGMKCSHVAASCWRAQVEAEQRIHSNWSAKYDRTEEMRRVDALENTLQREIDKRETYRAHNDALQTIVYRKDGADPGSAAKTYLDARKALAPQDKYPQPPTSALEVGWSVPAAMRNDEHFASSRLLNPNEQINQLATAYRRPDDRDHAELFGYTLERSY